MKAIQINHPREEMRIAQTSLALAVGARLYHDAAENTYAVSEDGKYMRRGGFFHIEAIPTEWKEGPADPIGGTVEQ